MDELDEPSDLNAILRRRPEKPTVKVPPETIEMLRRRCVRPPAHPRTVRR